VPSTVYRRRFDYRAKRLRYGRVRTFGSLAVPANTIAPSFTGGMDVGDLLSGANGTWTNSPTSYAYQWQHAEPVYDGDELVYDGAEIPANVVTLDYEDIAGATSINYTIESAVAGEMIRLRVIATNSAGSGSAAYSTQDGPVTFFAPTITSYSGLSATTLFPAVDDTEIADVDATGSPTLVFSLSGPDSALASVDASTGELTWDAPIEAGTYDVTVTATNDFGTDTQQFIIIVAAPGGDDGFFGPRIRVRRTVRVPVKRSTRTIVSED
jgi:hypothetical protein